MADSDTPAPSDAAASAYGADQIKILEGLEAVRKRPGMYIGDTGLAGLHHLVWEAVDNSIDEAMAGRATTVTVEVLADGSIAVTDDGSGIPVDPKRHDNPVYDGKPAVELVMTVLHAGGKFGEEGSAYKVSGGLHGVGISCVNALSERLDVEVKRDGKVHAIAFERGVTVEPLRVLSELPGDRASDTGTKIIFKPDTTLFPDTTFNFTTLATRLRELAYLNPGVIIRLRDERVDADGKLKDETFRFNEGLRAFVEHLNHSKSPLHEVVHLSGENPESHLAVEVAMQYSDSFNAVELTFANNIRTVDGGTHLSGFRTALTRTLNAYAKSAGLIKDKDPVPSGEDLREGLAVVISVKIPEPQFEGQTKGKLRNTEVEGFVAKIVSDKLKAWLEEHPGDAKRVAQKGLLAAQAREAARKARDLTRRKSALESGSMPAKLRDCTTKDVDRAEMFIVEGDSAGGSATQGRDIETQAILPLRGKLLNVERARLDKILGFEEIRTLIQALRCGIGEDFDASKLRYGRIIIMTDADVDGSHIRTLLLTFFFRQMPELIKRGHVYIAQPPLYAIVRGNKIIRYVLGERERIEELTQLGLEGASLLIRDDAALGEPSAEPAVERELTGDDAAKAVKLLKRLDELVTVVERRGIVFLDLLGERARDPEGADRLPTYRVHWRGGEAYAWSPEQVQQILANNTLTDDATVAAVNGSGAGNANGAARSGVTLATIRELNEVRELTALIPQLADLGLDIDSFGLTREEAVTGEQLPTKYAWKSPKRGKAAGTSEAPDAGADDADGADESVESEDTIDRASPAGYRVVEAPNLPGIMQALLELGRRGLEIKRFKGLGEMDPEQLWETTMDVTRRTLLRVNWDDASAADELFTTLMGENVENRRTYIEDHALEVKSLDV
ncbi:MAG: DNA gyrase subunit B [Planctomycetota bacterium]